MLPAACCERGGIGEDELMMRPTADTAAAMGGGISTLGAKALDDKQADHPGAPNGRNQDDQGTPPGFDTPDQEMRHLKATIAHLAQELEAERVRHRRSIDGARLLDDCVWNLQQRLAKANRFFVWRWLDMALNHVQSSREIAARLVRQGKRRLVFLLAPARQGAGVVGPVAQDAVLLVTSVAERLWVCCGRAFRRLLALKRPIRTKLRSLDWPRVQ